jgi:hypothetical protein
MINWKGCDRKLLWPNLRFYAGIILEGLRKTTKASIRIAGLRADFEPGTPECEAGMLSTRRRHSALSNGV